MRGVPLFLQLWLVVVPVAAASALGPRGQHTRRKRNLQQGLKMNYYNNDSLDTLSPATEEPVILNAKEKYKDDDGYYQNDDASATDDNTDDNVPKQAVEKDVDAPTEAPTAEPTAEPTSEPTSEPTAEPQVQQPAREKDQPNDDDQAETESPTFAPTTTAPTFVPTAVPTTKEPTLSPSTEATEAPVVDDEEIGVIESAQEAVATESPKKGDTTEEEEDVTDAPTEDPDASTLEAEEASYNATIGGGGGGREQDNVEDSTTTDDSYAVRLDPLYLTVEMEGEGFLEEGFMDILVDYMDTYMVQGFDNFEAVSYGVTLFSQTSDVAAGRAQSEQNPNTSNITVHVHLLTATFAGKPSVSNGVVEEYMTMLLEDAAMFQQYLDTNQPDLNANIFGISLEYESVVPPTDVQDNAGSSGSSGGDPSVNEAQKDGEKEAEEGASVGFIVGVTVACFIALLWMIFLFGIQSRASKSVPPATAAAAAE